MTDTLYKKGTVWDTTSRKGRLTILLQEDVDMSTDSFFDATILLGKAQYASKGNRLEQRINGKGTRGDTISFRTILTTFHNRREDLEQQIAAEQLRWREKASKKEKADQ